MKLPNLSPLKLFAPARHAVLQPAAAGVGGDGSTMFASRYDGGDDHEATEPAQRGGPPLRSSGGADSGGRQRTIQVPPEERYWTEYLRIALPIIGLLLMIGVFWFWAQQLIGDGNDPDEPIPTSTAGETSLTDDESTPEPTRPAVVDPDAGESTSPEEEVPPSTPDAGADEEPVSGGDNAADSEEPPAEDEPPAEEEEPPAEDEPAYAPEDQVVASEDLNLRSDPVVEDGNVVVTLPAGATLTIIEGPEAGEDYNWWNVVDEDGNSGWVAEDFIEPAE